MFNMTNAPRKLMLNWQGWNALEMTAQFRLPAMGVYVIAYDALSPRVVRVGQGDIASRLSEHRNNPTIQRYRANGPLKVAWAALSGYQVGGVEVYLANVLRPLVGDRFPNVTPIPVNLPTPFG